MDSKRPSATDVIVGQRIRTFRKAAGMSQTELADQVGITFQQLQKYEKGTNRVAAGRLPHIARRLMFPSHLSSTSLRNPAIGERKTTRHSMS